MTGRPGLRRLSAAASLILLAACGDQRGRLVDPRTNVVTPACPSPARLLGNPDTRLPDAYIVVFRDGVDARAVVARLEDRYAFKSRFVYTSGLLGFAADLSADQVAGVRCEPEVDYVEFDGVVTAD